MALTESPESSVSIKMHPKPASVPFKAYRHQILRDKLASEPDIYVQGLTINTPGSSVGKKYPHDMKVKSFIQNSNESVKPPSSKSAFILSLSQPDPSLKYARAPSTDRNSEQEVYVSFAN